MYTVHQKMETSNNFEVSVLGRYIAPNALPDALSPPSPGIPLYSLSADAERVSADCQQQYLFTPSINSLPDCSVLLDVRVTVLQRQQCVHVRVVGSVFVVRYRTGNFETWNCSGYRTFDVSYRMLDIVPKFSKHEQFLNMYFSMCLVPIGISY